MNTTVAAVPVIAMDEVSSSQIHSLGYDAASETLAIRFKNKAGAPEALYHYASFTAENWEAFRTAESLGSHFHRVIKANPLRFPFAKIDEGKKD